MPESYIVSGPIFLQSGFFSLIHLSPATSDVNLHESCVIISVLSPKSSGFINSICISPQII